MVTHIRPTNEAESADVPQVADDLPLLDEMLADLEQADPLYKPTNYWRYYFDTTVAALKRLGLRDFRRATEHAFDAFGGADFSIVPPWQKQATWLGKHLVKRGLGWLFDHGVPGRSLPRLPNLDELGIDKDDVLLHSMGLSTADLDEASFHVTEMFGRLCGARSLRELSASRAGNPAHAFHVDGSWYTQRTLFYYSRYAFTCQYIDYDQVANVVELGPGAGKQAEVLKKLHPHLNVYLLDLAPQLYVTSQFLKSAFPEDVSDYRQHRRTAITAARKGQILILGNWQIPAIAPEGPTLFWNCASFGEMEPEVVQNYLAHAARYSDAVYLCQATHGKETGDVGQRAVLKKTTFDEYERFLGDPFRLAGRGVARTPLMAPWRESGGYDEAVWTKQGGRVRPRLR